MIKFYAKVDTCNETTYDTKTLSVLALDGMRHTIRIASDAPIEVGEIYHFEAEPIVFKEKEQLLVKSYQILNEIPLTLAEQEKLMKGFYAYAPVAMETVKETIETILEDMQNQTIKTITMDLYTTYQDAFYLYPAATKFHHAYIGGLAHHTETMMRLGAGVLKVYPFLNKDLLMAGILLHDLCKTLELTSYKNPEYSTEGRLIGHITMGVKAIALTAKKHDLYDTEERMLLEHMLLSHHYYGNFGSPKKPNIPEALALHFIDNIDSKLAVLGEQLELIKEGEFTPPIPVLDREKFYKSYVKK